MAGGTFMIAAIESYLALRRTANNRKRGRALAGAGLALSYLHLVFWAYRVVAALVTAGAGSTFVIANLWVS